jgi:transcriptional regulator with XRE-family HTH domain
MTDRTPWAQVRDRRLPTADDRERYDAARQALDADLLAHRRTLRELRRARELTQTQLAASLRVSQAQVSRIETQADLYLSTLRSYVQAMGGDLELRVVFGDGGWAEVSLGEGAESFGSDDEVVFSGPDAPVRIAKGVYVVPRGDAWAVRRAGRTRASAVVGTEAEAIDRAREIVRGTGGQIVVERAAQA